MIQEHSVNATEKSGLMTYYRLCVGISLGPETTDVITETTDVITEITGVTPEKSLARSFCLFDSFHLSLFQ